VTRARPRGANQAPACSVVVRCFNEARHIGRLLSGILSQTVGAVDIVLVDSGSTDGTVAIASRYPVRLVAISPKDFTFGRSLNLGCQAARADLIVVASAHVYPVYPDWLERLLEPFQDRRIAMTYGKQRGDERTRFSEEQIFHKWFPETSVAWQDHPFCNNANAAIRKGAGRQCIPSTRVSRLEDIEWATWRWPGATAWLA
jgi:glycosyltransferase involved in cell wall biosynthesis